ncbi:hypothetical protein N7447_009515 [Penicillium robsamsonii]|uniref:uncharacterized protein n=1 Tax=Penicillium robsamsonii TaxID=1792511 RepID=UPI0025484ADA|nr:uncharacterized protein N7447_009515 [Penicillium robsamsonii]KAJ5817282.1 hypothetical protein N7447_009515 [Penicillium robsamsonii]
MSDSIFLYANAVRDDAVGTVEGSGQVPSSGSSTPKRLACDACRDRKIRCDKQRPVCGRCTKVGISCRYSSRARPTPSKTDLSRFLVTLNNRLSQFTCCADYKPAAEAQLAVDPFSQNPQSLPMLWDETNIGEPSTNAPSKRSSPDQAALPHAGIRDLDSDRGLSSDSVTDLNTSNNCSDLSDFDFATFAATLSTDQAMIQALGEVAENHDVDLMCSDMPPTPSSDSVASMLDPYTQSLHDRFFNVFHPSLPIVDRARFEREIAQVPPSIEVQALSYAIMTLGASSSLETHGQAERTYQEARSLLDICERQESGESLTSINTLQACTLLTLYELKRPNLARAWMTLGRAIGLSKIMSLEHPEGPSKQTTDWNLPTQFRPPASNSREAEERRRTFWILYIIDGFSSLRVNASPAFDKQASQALSLAYSGLSQMMLTRSVQVLLPLPSPSDHANSNVAPMPTLQQVFNSEVSPDTPISPFVGNAIMIFLYRQYLDHTRPSLQDQTYAFWEAHYRIDKAIKYCRTSLLARHLGGDSSLEPLSLVFRMNMDAVEMCLHKTALQKGRDDELPAALMADSTSKCMAAAQDVADALLVTRQLWGQRLDAFRQLDQFIVWPITTAIQNCLDRMKQGEREAHAGYYARVLRVLISAVSDLLQPGTISTALLEEARKAGVNGG